MPPGASLGLPQGLSAMMTLSAHPGIFAGIVIQLTLNPESKHAYLYTV